MPIHEYRASIFADQSDGSNALITSEPVPGYRWDNGLLARDEPDAVGHERLDGASDIVLLCDHAGARIPRRLGTLGVSADTLERHVALDIGALGVARGLSRALDAPLLFQRYSRLVIDCNRPPHVPGAFVVDADGARVRGNETLTPRDAASRVAELFHPYHSAIERCLSARLAQGRRTAIVSVHSFTPMLATDRVERPWQIGVLFRRDAGLAPALIRRLETEGDLVVGSTSPTRSTMSATTRSRCTPSAEPCRTWSSNCGRT